MMVVSLDRLQRFALRHKLILEDRGEVGFGRPCVGFLDRRGNYVDHNPHYYLPTGELNPPMASVAELRDGRLYPPSSVADAYHKHDCLAVLVHGDDYDEALRQLDAWVEHLESQGEVEVVAYETGATGLQAMMSGVIGYAVRIKP